ncbi:MAG: hypothetical protein FJ225_07555 [Lentisphaerae bacterium]|nr:hypothetical protein [Lentisphaerota bacterium]
MTRFVLRSIGFGAGLGSGGLGAGLGSGGLGAGFGGADTAAAETAGASTMNATGMIFSRLRLAHSQPTEKKTITTSSAA